MNALAKLSFGYGKSFKKCSEEIIQNCMKKNLCSLYSYLCKQKCEIENHLFKKHFAKAAFFSFHGKDGELLPNLRVMWIL